MLCLTASQFNNSVHTSTVPQLMDTLLLEPLSFTIFGRCSFMQNMTDSQTLYSYLRSIQNKNEKNSLWLDQIEKHLKQDPENKIRYIKLNDSDDKKISRIHMVIKQNIYSQQYSIMDVNSLDGLYVDDMKIPSMTWNHLKVGQKIRFSSSSEYTFISKVESDKATKKRKRDEDIDSITSLFQLSISSIKRSRLDEIYESTKIIRRYSAP